MPVMPPPPVAVTVPLIAPAATIAALMLDVVEPAVTAT